MDIFKSIYDTLNTYFTNEQLIYFGSLLALLTAFLAFYRANLKEYVLAFGKWSSHIYNSFEHVDRIEKTLEKVSKDVEINKTKYDEDIKNIVANIDFIQKELSPNSGKSIKDLIDKIVKSMQAMEKISTSLEYQVKKIESRQWTILINNNDYPMYETNEKGLCIRANKAYLDLIGLHLEDVVNMGWVNSILVDDRKLVQNEWDSAIEDKRSFDLKYRIQNVINNKVFFVRCMCQPYFVDAEVIGYIGKFLIIYEMIQDSSGMWVKKPN
jgi:PAS domain-containing protein